MLFSKAVSHHNPIDVIVSILWQRDPKRAEIGGECSKVPSSHEHRGPRKQRSGTGCLLLSHKLPPKLSILNNKHSLLASVGQEFGSSRGSGVLV